MMGEERLNSFMMEVPHIETSPLICRANQLDWFLCDRDLRHERVNALLLVRTY